MFQTLTLANIVPSAVFAANRKLIVNFLFSMLTKKFLHIKIYKSREAMRGFLYIAERTDSMIKKLGEQNIQTRPIWSLIHKQKPYQNSQAFEIEKAIYYQDRIVNLPCSTNLTKEEIDYIKTKIN